MIVTSGVGRLKTIAPHKINVRFLEVAWGFAKFSAFFLVVLNANHELNGQIRRLISRGRPGTESRDKGGPGAFRVFR